ncbi:MAG: acyltransferase [Ferruginibacter sp.]
MFSRKNNFDIIRLLAATQVLVFHSLEHLNVKEYLPSFTNKLLQILRYFPGVPVFFSISGFLIFASFAGKPVSIRQYCKNRVLRIYPALWVALIFTICLILFTGGIRFDRSFLAWVFGQLSLFQFYNIQQFRDWGVGVPNGSLWTITIELQFYFLVPFIFVAFKRFNKTVVAISLIILSILCYILLKAFDNESFVMKLGKVFILPYLFNFLFGVLIFIYWDNLKNIIENKAWLWMTIYLSYVCLFGIYLNYYNPDYWPANIFGMVGYALLTLVVFSCAFSAKSLTKIVLNGNDLSYGIYIYHMLWINFLVAIGYSGHIWSFFLAASLTVASAFLSWKLIEKPALKLK